MEYSTKTINLKRRSGSLVIHVLHASNPVAQRLHIICVSFQVNELFYRSLTFAMEKFTRILFVVVPAVNMLGWLGESLSNQIVAWNSLGKTRAFVIIQIIFVGKRPTLSLPNEEQVTDSQTEGVCSLMEYVATGLHAGIKKAKRQQVSIVGNASKSRRPCCELLYYYDCRNSSSIRRCCLRGSKAQAKVGGLDSVSCRRLAWQPGRQTLFPPTAAAKQ